MGENQYLYKKIEETVSDLYKQAGKNILLTHSRRTVFWVLNLKPDADEALMIAALAHDIERLSPGPPSERMVAGASKGFADQAFLRQHSTKGAEIIGKILADLAAEPELIEQVKFLVAGHEFFGTDDQNLLKDADSLSFFENNVKEFLHVKVKMYGKEKVRAKFNWMYKRITSDAARKIVAPWYQQAVERLDNGDTESG